MVRRRPLLRGALTTLLLSLLGGAATANADELPATGAPPPDGDSAAAVTTYGPATWMRIPAIEVDSEVSEVGISDGVYDVPWFGVGHQSDSHDPGEIGNSIFNGHVLTIDAGRVFYRLHELQPGDAVYVYTPAYRLDWVVSDVFSAALTEYQFLLDTDQPQITLYTCTGQFDFIERSFADRLVAIGQLVSVNPR